MPSICCSRLKPRRCRNAGPTWRRWVIVPYANGLRRSAMSDGKLFQLAALALGLVLLWQLLGWISRSPQDRWVQLATIAEEEQLQSMPPQSLLEQARWLITARLLRLRGL